MVQRVVVGRLLAAVGLGAVVAGVVTLPATTADATPVATAPVVLEREEPTIDVPGVLAGRVGDARTAADSAVECAERRAAQQQGDARDRRTAERWYNADPAGRAELDPGESALHRADRDDPVRVPRGRGGGQRRLIGMRAASRRN
jgi:hypothetical protein